MVKILFQGVIIILIFLVSWFALSKVDWITAFGIEKLNKDTEEKLGEIFWDLFSKEGKEIKDPEFAATLDCLLEAICEANQLDHSRIKLHVIENDEINAFALSGSQIVLLSGLINDCTNEAELCGVLCHELAHIELDHVMKKLVREIGLSLLLSVATGNGNTEIIRESAKILSSTAYDRKMEREADRRAVDFLLKTGIDPNAFAGFLSRLSSNETKIEKRLTWISTHPGSEERSVAIKEYCKNRRLSPVSILTDESWLALKQCMEEI